MIAVSKDREQPFEFYSFLGTDKKVSSQTIFSEVMASTILNNPVIFGLVEGGCFSIGLIHKGEITNLGMVVDYFRGIKAMWLAALEIKRSEAEKIIEERSANNS